MAPDEPTRAEFDHIKENIKTLWEHIDVVKEELFTGVGILKTLKWIGISCCMIGISIISWLAVKTIDLEKEQITYGFKSYMSEQDILALKKNVSDLNDNIDDKFESLEKNMSEEFGSVRRHYRGNNGDDNK